MLLVLAIYLASIDFLESIEYSCNIAMVLRFHQDLILKFVI